VEQRFNWSIRSSEGFSRQNQKNVLNQMHAAQLMMLQLAQGERETDERRSQTTAISQSK
jgi:hypothetical protein